MERGDIMPSSRRRASRKRNSILPIHPPKQVLRLIDRLQKHGVEAYAVGVCIRDSLLGLSPNDWDLTCSAHPEEVEMCIRDRRMGADALLSVTPYYNKTSQTGLIRHYTYIADRVHLPMICLLYTSRCV